MAYRLAGINGTVYNRLKQAGLDAFAPAFHCEVYDKLVTRLGTVKPRRIFIASMGDIGSDGEYKVTTNESFLSHGISSARVMHKIRALCIAFPQHTFLFLSKNPKAFNSYNWPKNAHIGTSIDSCGADENKRISELYKVSANVHWLSIEPLLDPDFDQHILSKCEITPDWVVVGGLSGKKPLPDGCLNAVERIVLWCKARSIPVFVKDNVEQTGAPWPKEIL
jgi:protein gp37